MRRGLVILAVVALGGVVLPAFAQVPAASAAPAPTVAPPAVVPPVVAPRRVEGAAVPYPANAQGDANVQLVVTVSAEGAVTQVSVQEGSEPFASVAAAAVREWRYEPATRGGRAIAAKIRIEVSFVAPRIEPEPDPAAEPDPDPSAKSVSARGKRGALAAEPEEVRVRGERSEPGRSATLSRTEVRQIPGAFGDPFRAIEVLPGVTPILSGLPFFYIRGAPPGNVGYFLDGVRVPLLFHVGAGPSVVHPALISRVDLYPGGYPARFGRYAGGIVSGETAKPEQSIHGEYNLRLFDAGALVETPFADGRGSVLVGGRYSYTAALLTQLSPDTTLDYWDYQARVSYDLSRDDRVSVFSFGSYDFLGQRTQTETITAFGTEFHRIDFRYDHALSRDGNLRTAVTIGVDRSRFQEDRYVRSRLVGTRAEISQRLSTRSIARFGTDAEVTHYDVDTGGADLGPSASQIAASFPTRADLMAGIRGDIVHQLTPRLEIVPGARLDFYASGGATAIGIDPRLATRTAVTSKLRILAALGIAHQAPSFVIPAPGVQPGGLERGLQRSIQESVGVELDVAEGTTATVTVFHNGFFDMTDALGVQQREPTGCPPGSYPKGAFAGDRGFQGTGTGGNVCGEPRFRPGTLGPDRSGGGGGGADSRNAARTAQAFEVRTLGSSMGLELFLKRKLSSRLGGFVSYTLSRSTRIFGDSQYLSSFDRTHVANAALAFDLGKGWRAGTRGVFYTGLPKLAVPTDPSTRLPPFFRLDLRLEKRWRLGQRAWIAAVAEWMNATLSKEALSTRCTLQGCESQTVGPVTIPSLGVEGAF